jgi:hypothetical protein
LLKCSIILLSFNITKSSGTTEIHYSCDESHTTFLLLLVGH